jgi:hypothetical protein
MHGRPSQYPVVGRGVRRGRELTIHDPPALIAAAVRCFVHWARERRCGGSWVQDVITRQGCGDRCVR